MNNLLLSTVAWPPISYHELWWALIPALDLNSLVIRLLAVAGGAAFGALFLDLLIRFIARFVFVRKVPRPALLGGRLLGALTLGLAVWIMLFGVGGPGWGIGGGGSLFGGRGSGEGESQESNVSTNPSTSVAVSIQGTSLAAPEETLYVTMLGGDQVKEKRFYRVQGEGEAQTLAEVKKVVLERQAKGPLKAIEILIYEDSVDDHHSAVRALISWASDHDLAAPILHKRGEGPSKG